MTMKILIIEDRKEMAEILSDILREVSSQIYVAPTVAEAFRLLNEVPVLDLITVDVGLPDAASRDDVILKLPDMRSLQQDAVIVVISGVINADDEAIILKSGADGVLMKWDVPTGEELLRRLLGIAKAIKETPTRWQRSIAVADYMAHRLADFLDAHAESSRESLRASLAFH